MKGYIYQRSQADFWYKILMFSIKLVTIKTKVQQKIRSATPINGQDSQATPGGMKDANFLAKRMKWGEVEMKRWHMIILVTISAIFIGGTTEARVIFQDDFDSYSDSPENHGWGTSSNISLQTSGGVNNSHCAMVTYDRSGTSPYWFGVNVANENMSEIYVRFYFRVDDPSGGCKFLKLFGIRNGDSYANSTFGLNYYSNTLNDVQYGGGDGLSNDSQRIIRFNGTRSDENVTIHKSTGEFDPRDGKWHCFEAHMKYNDNGQRNGIYRVWIDGEMRLHAANVKNRNDLNSRFFESVQLANYCHSNWSHLWHLWFDDVVIADEPIGPIGTEVLDKNPPSAPRGINATVVP